MEERRIGRYYHPDSDTEWQVVEWGDRGSMKNIDENRLTRAGITRSQITTFAIVYPNGDVQHRTFSGYLPEDLDDVAEYWFDNESL